MKWMILRYSELHSVWEETSSRAPNREDMEELLKRVQRAHTSKEHYCSVPDPTTIAHHKMGVQVFDFQGVGACWQAGCDASPCYEVVSYARPALVCHRHITRYLRCHAEVRSV